MQHFKSLASSMIQEQQFGELVQSIKHNTNNICDEQSQKFYSLINESIQLQYELIQNQEASKLSNLQLLKISNFQFIKSHECYFCIIFNLSNDTLKQKLKNEIMKYSFQSHFCDFTLGNVNNCNLNTEFEAFDNYSDQKFRECRILIFSQDFDQKIIEKINSFPYIYFCGDPTNVNEIYLENLQLHQIFLTLDLQYSKIGVNKLYKRILQLLPTGLSILNQLIYTNIKITGFIEDIKDTIYQIKHPSLKCEKLEENNIIIYQIPYIFVFYFQLTINKISV